MNQEKLKSVRATVVKGDCWEWPGHLTKKGYARRKHNGKQINIHRVIFEGVIRHIPEGLVLDHLCRNRACVNPFHLEIVSNVENVMRGVGLGALNYQKENCKRGHPLSGANIRMDKNGARICITCRTAYQQSYDKKRRHGN